MKVAYTSSNIHLLALLLTPWTLSLRRILITLSSQDEGGKKSRINGEDCGDPREMEMSVLDFFRVYIKPQMDRWCCRWGLQYCAYRRFPKGPNIEVIITAILLIFMYFEIGVWVPWKYQ
jgi:hypothetical protein